VSDAPLRVLSWNVNGLRACARKGFGDWLRRARADVVGLQEVRALPEELPGPLRAPRRYRATWVPAERRGYSGVALYSRCEPDHIETGLGRPRFDVEGRFVLARFGRLAIANGYFPKGSGTLRDNSRVPYKLAFYRAVFERVEKLRRAGLRVLVMGDLNTAHREIDLARPYPPPIGWRIDAVLASPAAMRFVRGAFHQPDVMGSDHCPIGVELDRAVLC